VSLDVLALPVNFVQDLAVSKSHEGHRNPSEGDGTEDIVDDNHFLRFFRVVVCDIFAQISPGKLDECQEERKKPDECQHLETTALRDPTLVS